MPRRKTTDEFKKEIKNLKGDEYILLGEYINNHTKIKMLHTTCGNEFFIRPMNFLNGNGCNICGYKKSIKNRTKTHEQYLKEINEKYGNEYIILEKYINIHTKILTKHNTCGYIWKVAPDSLLTKNNNNCPKCANKIRGRKRLISNEDYIKNVYDLVKNEYTVIGEYIGNKYKIEYKHNICNRSFFMKPRDFKKGERCPFCKKSRGEKAISNYLDFLKIKYKQEVSFPDCKYKSTLRFDFQIITNNDIIILIEYDGIQHFEKNFQFYESENTFETQQLRDRIKDEYCNNNPNIHLYRIKYTEFDNIEGIINNIIKIEGSTTIERIA